MNLYIFSVIVVDTWSAKSAIVGDKKVELEKCIYEGLAEEMLDNKFKNMYNIKIRTQGTADDLSIT